MKFSDFSNEKYRLNSFSVRIKYQPTVPNFLDSSLNNIKHFPDFSNIIDSKSLTRYNAQYTATQNCYICGAISSNNEAFFAQILVDNVIVASTNSAYSVLIPVGKGSVVTTRDHSGTAYDLTVYGVK